MVGDDPVTNLSHTVTQMYGCSCDFPGFSPFDYVSHECETLLTVQIQTPISQWMDAVDKSHPDEKNDHV